tara:strand:- start:5872 stop:6138 length:267 start_codon:yes stop_codon:yes gene_type:complete
MTDERIEQLFQQVMDETCKDPLRRFAELVAADEREACAKLCDDASLYFVDQGMNAVDGADYCANEIRGRTELNPDFKNQMDDNWAGLI